MTTATTSRFRRTATALTASAALGVGVLGFSNLNPLSSAAAQEDSTQEETSTDDANRHPGARLLTTALDELVAEGTLDQNQADAVVSKVQELRPDRPGDGHGPRGPRMRILANAFETAADTIGVDVSDLRDARQNGESIADVATANDVDPQTVIDAIVASANEKLDEKVADGTIDEDRAAEARENIAEAAENFVNNTRP